MTYWETTKGTLELLAGYVAITRSFFSGKKNLGTHGGWFTAFSNTFFNYREMRTRLPGARAGRVDAGHVK